MKAAPHYGYVQLSNMFWRSPKTFTLLRTNPAALGYFTVLLSWAGDNLSDGLLPSNVINGLFAVPQDSLAALLSVGFLEQRQNGYQIHDYLDWNRSKTQIEQEAEKKREQARLRKQKQRAQTEKSEENVSVTLMSRTSHAPVTPLSRTTTEQQNYRTTEQHISFSPKSSSSRFAASSYEPSEKKKEELIENQKINPNKYTKLLAGFHAWWDEQDELKSQTQWDHLFAGWVAKSKNRPEYQTHTHTWACEHTLHALHASSTGEVTARYEEPTRGVQLAQHVARNLNNGLSEKEAVQQAEEQMFD